MKKTFDPSGMHRAAPREVVMPDDGLGEITIWCVAFGVGRSRFFFALV